MMWHFYEIPYIPDLELVKYQSLGEQGIDGILERHNRFLRQWQRNTVLIHTTLHFFLSYTPVSYTHLTLPTILLV